MIYYEHNFQSNNPSKTLSANPVKTMSLKIIDRHIKTIYDKNGKKIFKIPGNTSLDHILTDLWTEILKYMDYYPFAMGTDKGNDKENGIEQLGYREITYEEFDKKKEQFIRYYWKNHGLFTFDQIHLSYDNYLMIGDHFITIYGHRIHFVHSNANCVTPLTNEISSDIQIDDVSYMYHDKIYCHDELFVLLVPDI